MNDYANCSTVCQETETPNSRLPTEVAPSAAAIPENIWNEEYVVKSEAESMQNKAENIIESHVPPDPSDTSHLKTEQTDNHEFQILQTIKMCDEDDPDEDIELQNVLDLENVLKRMHAPSAGFERMDVGDDSSSSENELDLVMRLENVLRKVNGNLSEFQLVQAALRKIHEAVLLDDGNDFECASLGIHRGVNRISDVELAIQNDALILDDDFRESFSSIEEWASSQIKQQEGLGALQRDNSSFSKREGEVMKSAKILFAKKTKTLFRWLHPKDTKADLRQRVDRAWDSLSPNETEFYYSQVLGPFNHRQVKPMINPRIFELLNIPEALRPAPGTSSNADDTSQPSTDEPKTAKIGRSRKSSTSKATSAGLPRRKRGPYKKTVQAMEEKRKKRSRSTSSSSDQEYLPNASAKRSKGTKKKKITNIGKLRIKFFKMKTSKLPESSESDDSYDDEEVEDDNNAPYKRHFGRVALTPDCEISAEVAQGLEECDKLLGGSI